MREILKELNREPGIVGSMIITPDGIMVAAALGPEFEEDSVAAFASSLLLSLKKSLASLSSRGDMTSCTLNASGGQISFFDMKNSYLMVVARPDARIETSTTTIQNAIHKIKTRRVA